MSIYGYRLTSRQQDIRDDVCSGGSTLTERIQLLSHLANYGVDPADDIGAVRSWLWEIHHEEVPHTCPWPWKSLQ